MIDKIIYTIIGIILGVVGVIVGNYSIFSYPIDWGATGNWALVIVAIVASIVAYSEVTESRRLQRVELTHDYIREIRRLISEGIVNEAQKHVARMSYNMPPYDKNTQIVVYFYEELGIMYKENIIERKLILPLLGNLPDVYSSFSKYIQAWRTKSNDAEQFTNWEYLKDQVINNTTKQ